MITKYYIANGKKIKKRGRMNSKRVRKTIC